MRKREARTAGRRGLPARRAREGPAGRRAARGRDPRAVAGAQNEAARREEKPFQKGGWVGEVVGSQTLAERTERGRGTREGREAWSEAAARPKRRKPRARGPKRARGRAAAERIPQKKSEAARKGTPSFASFPQGSERSLPV